MSVEKIRTGLKADDALYKRVEKETRRRLRQIRTGKALHLNLFERVALCVAGRLNGRHSQPRARGRPGQRGSVAHRQRRHKRSSCLPKQKSRAARRRVGNGRSPAEHVHIAQGLRNSSHHVIIHDWNIRETPAYFGI